MTIDILESELMPYFTTGQRKILRSLAQTIVDAAVAQIVADPSVLNLELNDLTDVNIVTPADADVLTFDDPTDLWTADPVPGGGGGSVLPVVLNTSIGGVDAELDWSSTMQWFTEAEVIEVTIPLQADVAWADNAEFHLIQGTDVIYLGITPDPGITVVSAATGARQSGGDGQVVICKRLAEDVWLIYGDVVSG